MIDQAMRAFLSACRSAGPIVLGVEEPGTSGVSWRVFDQPFLVVGRAPGADLFLNDPGVSRRHAYLQLIAGRLFCVDLQSRTGTHWGDEPGLWGWVQSDPGIRIGPFRLRHRDGGPGESLARVADDSTLPVPVSRSFAQPELPEATVEILGDPACSPTWRVSRTLVLIGGSQSCKIRLQGGGVSNIHASLLRTPDGIFAIDLLGQGGIFVNGDRVRWARLGVDDEISVGEHRLRVRCGRSGVHAEHRRGGGRRKSTSSPDIPAKVGTFGSGLMPTPSAIGDETVSLVRSMLDEFGQAQMQMADRFQETVMVVLQSFAGLHGEQMALIREEMARIRELSKEQEALRSQAEGHGFGGSSPPALRLVACESRATPEGPHPNAMPPAPQSRTGRTPPSPTNEGRVEREEAAGPAASRAEESRPHPPVPSDLHSQIVNRLAEIQEERQGRWQKLLKSLLG